MRALYSGLSNGEKAFVWIGAAALVLLIIGVGRPNLGLAAVAQAAAALGTFLLAALALAEVREMRKARVAQDRPLVIVEADYSSYPVVNVVARNVGKGAAKDITFACSDELPTSFQPRGSLRTLTVNEISFLGKGLSYLSSGAGAATHWGDHAELERLLEKRGLKDGITITSKYRSLDGYPFDTPSVINPLRMDPVPSEEKGMGHLVEAVEHIQENLSRLVSDQLPRTNDPTETGRYTETRGGKKQDDGRDVGGDDA